MPGTFTIPLWEVLDIEADNGSGYRIGLNDYPIFDPSYRDYLNTFIIRHFHNREIAHETISQFTFATRRKMWEIMPLYNQVYKTTQIEFDPMATIDIHTVRADNVAETGTAASTTAATANSNSGSRTVNSDTPQTQLSGDEDYATSATDATSANTATNNGSQNSNTSNTNSLNGDSRTTGFQAIPSDLLLKYRSTLLNVDMMVVQELNELFFGLWDNTQEMSPNRDLYKLGWGY